MTSPPAYLTEYLNKIAKDEGFVEHTLHYESGSNHGDGFIAVMLAVTIKGKQMVDVDDEKELSLMCKLLPANEARRAFFNSVMLFEREVYVYSRVLPVFEKFQIERGISMNDGFFQYPKCYVAVADAATDHYVIVMKNVKVLNYELWDKMKPVDFDTSSIFLQALGRYHGMSMALRDQKPVEFQELLLNLQQIMTNMIELPNITKMMASSMNKAIEHLTCEDEKNILRKLRDNYKATVQSLFAPNAAGQLEVLLHGDCWNNNFCFKNDANIESLDDHSGRLLIKLALGSTKDWFNEFMVQPVSKAEFAQYGKVLNYAKYEEYRKKQEDKERLDNLKIEKDESLQSTSKPYQRHGQSSNSSSTQEDANDRRISSSKSHNHPTSDRHSTHRERSYSLSDDDRRNADRTSKYRSTPETSIRKSKNASNQKSSDDSGSDRREKYSSNRSSHKKTKSKKHFKSRSYSKDHRQRYYSSDEADKHHNKKTKKSKRARSRSRDRR